MGVNVSSSFGQSCVGTVASNGIAEFNRPL